MMTFSQFGNFISDKKSELNKFKNTLIRSTEEHIFSNKQNLKNINSQDQTKTNDDINEKNKVYNVNKYKDD